MGNPPYITVKDKQENENYRKAYSSCSGKYALSVPFAERFFQLAIRGAKDGRGSGYVGQITSNSFMKREFGKKLIEEFFKKVDLTHVIDTSGAYIPGHGTPTVILIGRRRWPRQDSAVRAVLGVRGEPGEPKIPSRGLVWLAIVSQVSQPGSESEWVSVADLDRNRLAAHPWALAGSGAGETLELMGKNRRPIRDVISEIGMTVLTLEDDFYLRPISAMPRLDSIDFFVPLAKGDGVRDFAIEVSDVMLMPNDWNGQRRQVTAGVARMLYPWRTNLVPSSIFRESA